MESLRYDNERNKILGERTNYDFTIDDYKAYPNGSIHNLGGQYTFEIKLPKLIAQNTITPVVNETGTRVAKITTFKPLSEFKDKFVEAFGKSSLELPVVYPTMSDERRVEKLIEHFKFENNHLIMSENDDKYDPISTFVHMYKYPYEKGLEGELSTWRKLACVSG